MSNDKRTLGAATLKVIEGGRSVTDNKAKTSGYGPAIGAATAHALEEEERLRQAILQTTLRRAKVNVRQALSELAAPESSSEDETLQVRLGVLQSELADLGISYIRAHSRPDREGARWALTHPDRLLSAKPNVAALYPLAHHMLVVAWEEAIHEHVSGA